MVNAAQISKLGAYAPTTPPSTGVSVSKLGADAVTAPPQAGVSVSKLSGEAITAPPQNSVSIAKFRAYAVITLRMDTVPDYTWPQSLLVPKKAKLIPLAFNTSGGQGFTNVEQVIGNSPGRWRLDLSEVRIKTVDQRLAWDQLEYGLQGRSRTVGVPLYRWMTGLVPWPTIGGVLTTSAPGYTVPVILAVSEGQVLEGAVTMTIRVSQGAALKAGYIFGVNYKVYAITEITAVLTAHSPPEPAYTLKFWPPLRERIEDQDSLNFDNPILRCRLAEDLSMAVEGGWDYWKRGAPSLTFVEDVTTPSPDSP